MKTLLMAVAVVGMLGSGAAMAEGGGESLLRYCKSAILDKKDLGDAFGSGYCLGIITAVGELLPPADASVICVPSGVNNKQMARIVVKYLEQNPEQLHKNATTLTIMATKKAFPCKK